eukprot:6057122-Pleurochrysis_carterae.AAC.1
MENARVATGDGSTCESVLNTAARSAPKSAEFAPCMQIDENEEAACEARLSVSTFVRLWALTLMLVMMLMLTVRARFSPCQATHNDETGIAGARMLTEF